MHTASRTVVILIAVLCLGSFAKAQQPQQAGPYKDSRDVPETPAAQRGQELLKLLADADAAELRAYVEANFAPAFLEQIPMNDHVEVLSDFARTAKHLKLHGARSYDPPRPATQAVLILYNDLAESWEAIVVEVEDAPPHRITSLQFAPARPPTDVPPAPPISQSEAVSKLKQYVQRLADEGLFSGTVLLAKGDEILYEAAFGEADMNHHVPSNIDTKFNLGSMNKMFTAVAIAQLAEQDKLSFDDPISKYLDESWLPKATADKIRIKHLLTHTSGLGSYFNAKFMESSRLKFREVDDYKPLLEGETLAFEPGTESRYSNTGFLLLGAIIEKASGQNYFDYIREHVYKPAGMTRSDSYDLDEVVENLAIGYFREGGELKTNTFLHVVRGGPAGGGYSTVRDLHRFAQALRTDKLVSADTRELLWSPKPSSPEYGYGFGVFDASGQRIVGHGGGFPGISSDLAIFTDSGWTVAVMSNRGSAQDVSSRARALIVSIADD